MILNNLDAVRIVARRLGSLIDRVAFLGGATTNLFITDPGARATRLTRDVDIVVEAASPMEYRLSLRHELLQHGFSEDTDEDAPICRWVVDGVKVNVMPTTEGVLGFTNRWYRAALATAAPYALPDGPTIRLITAPYFLATKLEAFGDRGRGDFQASIDFEDIVAVLDGRLEIEVEVASAAPDVRTYLAAELKRYLAEEEFIEALPGHLEGDEASQARAPRLVDLLQRLANP